MFKDDRRPLRIAILCLEKGGGISHCAYELAKAMAGMAEVTCYLAAQNNMLGKFEALPVAVKAYPFRRGPRALLRAIVRRRDSTGAAAAMASDSPDIVLDAGSGAWASIVVGALGGRLPVAQVVHDVYPHPDFRSRLDALPGIIQPTAADVLVALSDFSYRQMERRYSSMPRIRSKLGSLMSPADFDANSMVLRRNRHLFTGRIYPYKGIESLVEAFGFARKANPQLELNIVGRGRIPRQVLRKINELGIGLHNRYVGDDEMKDFMASHGVMILPYTSATQSAVAALALANGMPSIATNVGGLPEHVVQGRNGLIVPPRDPRALAQAMVEISTDADLARRMANEAYRMGREEFAWLNIARDLVEDLSRFLRSGVRQQGGHATRP